MDTGISNLLKLFRNLNPIEGIAQFLGQIFPNFSPKQD